MGYFLEVLKEGWPEGVMQINNEQRRHRDIIPGMAVSTKDVFCK
jgi:hypothetical protein